MSAHCQYWQWGKGAYMKGAKVMTNDLAFNYFIGNEGEQFNFIKVPKMFFTDAKFEKLSYGAKILYGLLLDRMSLSIKNRWLDDKKRVYVVYTIESIGEDFRVSKTVAIRFLKELEEFGLVEKKKRPNEATMIYVKNFVLQEEIKEEIPENQGSPEYGSPEVLNMEVQNMESRKSARIQGSLKCGIPKCGIPEVQNMESNKTNRYKAYNISSSSIDKQDDDIKEQILQRIQYKKIVSSNRFDKGLVDKVVDCLVALYTAPKNGYRMDKAYIPAVKMQERIKARLTEENFVQILTNISTNGTGTIYNLHGYILTCFYNLMTVETKSNNKFNEYLQNDYDFDALEKELLSN